MSGTNQSKVRVVLRNPLNFKDQIDYTITPFDNPLARDWIVALKELLQSGNLLEKNFCFLGFPKSQRTLEYLCNELNSAIETINKFNLIGEWQQAGLKSYIIEDWFHPNVVRYPDSYPVTKGIVNQFNATHNLDEFGLGLKTETMNRLHNHFEILQGSVWNLSEYYKIANYDTKYAIRQLNNLCHEIENLVLSQRKVVTAPEWIRPSQITTFLHAKRYDLTDEHRQLFLENGFDRMFGTVYMHWTQIGKTLFEVFRDENAPKLNVGNDPTNISFNTGATCEAINSLRYYSGEFDVEWGQSIYLNKQGKFPWHSQQQEDFKQWLKNNGIDDKNKNLSLGYLPIGQIKTKEDFGTDIPIEVWNILSNYLDIYKIEIDDVSNTFDYCWSDSTYKQMQIDIMRPGYDFSSRRR